MMFMDEASNARITYMLSKYNEETDKGETLADTLVRLLKELDAYRLKGSIDWIHDLGQRVAVDIDGTVASTLKMGKYPDDYMKKKVLPGAIDGLRAIRKLGLSVIFFTARPECDRSITEAWLSANGFSGLYDRLIMDKPTYITLIDDRAIGFKGNWEAAIAELKARYLYDTE